MRYNCTTSLYKTIKYYKKLLDDLKIQWKRDYELAIHNRYPNDIAIENYFIDIIRGYKK